MTCKLPKWMNANSLIQSTEVQIKNSYFYVYEKEALLRDLTEMSTFSNYMHILWAQNVKQKTCLYHYCYRIFPLLMSKILIDIFCQKDP
jgi:hypothetical protein